MSKCTRTTFLKVWRKLKSGCRRTYSISPKCPQVCKHLYPSLVGKQCILVCNVLQNLKRQINWVSKCDAANWKWILVTNTKKEIECNSKDFGLWNSLVTRVFRVGHGTRLHRLPFLFCMCIACSFLVVGLSFICQTISGQPHEGSSYAAQKDLQMAFHRLEHVRSRLMVSDGQFPFQHNYFQSSDFTTPPRGIEDPCSLRKCVLGGGGGAVCGVPQRKKNWWRTDVRMFGALLPPPEQAFYHNGTLIQCTFTPGRHRARS